MKYYTLFLGNKMFDTVIDDMNTTEIWAVGGMLWNSRKKADKCMKRLQSPEYEIDDKSKKLRVVELKLK